MEYCRGHAADKEGLSDLANGIYLRILPAHPTEYGQLWPYQSVAVNWWVGRLPNWLPLWRLKIIHWLMGFFFNPFIPSTIKLKCMALFVVILQFRWLFNVQYKFPNSKAKYFDWVTEICKKFKLWATSFCTWLLNVILHLQIARCQDQMFHLWPTSETSTEPHGPH